MREDWIPFLRCPETGTPYDVDATRGADAELVEAFLVARGGRALRPVLAGIAVLPPELPSYLRTHGPVFLRIPIADSRMARFVLGRLGSESDDFVPFDEVVSRYVDLARVETNAADPHPIDAGLEAFLREAELRATRALDIGCGVGRGSFVLRSAADAVLGVDRSIARVRRARNIAVTQADFFLPPPAGVDAKEVPLDLDRLVREGVDFAVGDPARLPLGDAVFDLVLLREADGRGVWPDPALVEQEAIRVLAPGGTLVREGGVGPDGWSPGLALGGYSSWRRP